MNQMSNECKAISRKYVESLLDQLVKEQAGAVPFTVYLPHLGKMIESLFHNDPSCSDVYIVGPYRVTVVNERGSCYPPFCGVHRCQPK